MSQIVIEVGANKGTDTVKFLDAGDIVYAFEPTPELILELKNKFKHYSNYKPVNLAVDTVNGWSWFNIAGQHDWGCSSLHDFNPNIHAEWTERPDFKFTDRCQVQTIRLDDFITLYGIQTVDYLWVDAQGNDFRVLQSLGQKISLVKAGRCEAADTVNLYTNVDNTKESIGSWLENQGFEICVDCYNGKEADIHFLRR